MFNRLRSKMSNLMAAAVLTMGALFNRNVTLPSVVAAPAALPTRRKPAFRNGIKGIKGAHLGRYGATLAYRLQQSRSGVKASA